MTEKFVGLAAFDEASGENEMIYAFSSITLISPGGFIAVSYFQNRSLTEDIDIIIDPEHVKDREIIGLLRSLMVQQKHCPLSGKHLRVLEAHLWNGAPTDMQDILEILNTLMKEHKVAEAYQARSGEMPFCYEDEEALHLN
ncbi:hypothetical protein PAAG_00571 [Paracoccidioides lutzii Pb01]|uniref:Uncharacterized protein n=1 Tax=Paracoccidioides lutzii (strain ATCC MYA-826 / Pb01) TaxID=502779 RepID=C1GPX6_PARBA|nr:hypothetical protein PAAG_00571 [Paracoccidioides lutzii Pb01]EEH36248.2 hypothetical protein PAAG_00571 [Paracoccidioides lutzii Pb01]